MKKILITLLAGAMTITTLTACSEQTPPINNEGQNLSNENSVAIFQGVIDEITDTSAIVKPNNDQEHILSSGDKVKVNLSVSDDKFSVGDEIVVYYTGDIMESYPLQIDTVDVEVAEEFESIQVEDNEKADNSNIETNELLPTAKIAINIEGIVTAVEGNKITLDSGKVVFITDETAFETQNVGEIVPIDSEILVGNFIQGFTLDDENLDEVTALVINSNGVLDAPIQNPEIGDDSSMIYTEIIIRVTKDFDGTLTDELKNLGVVSIRNIFDYEDTIMYVVETEEPVENIIEKLEELDHVNYAEYDQMVSICN